MSKTTLWIVIIIIGGLSGLFIGELLASMAPDGFFKDVFGKSIVFGLQPPGTLDLKFLALTLGFQVKMTLMGLVGIAVAFYLGRSL